MKVFYPNDGISSKIKPMLNDSLTHLSNAQDYLSMSIPSNFEYINYLRGLGGKIGELKSKISDVYGKAASTDMLFSGARENIEAVNETADINVIKKRDRLVK